MWAGPGDVPPAGWDMCDSGWDPIKAPRGQAGLGPRSTKLHSAAFQRRRNFIRGGEGDWEEVVHALKDTGRG